MKWVVGGPDLPLKLLQAVEDGRLVFFCGAGVSFQAGLRGFEWLVEEVYSRLNDTFSDTERDEFNAKRFDRVFGQLETRIGRTLVREKVVDVLRLRDEADLGTHRALVDLATAPSGECRIVTTNFDQAFERVTGGRVPLDSYPRLPIPKPATWNSVVHLHGRISEADRSGQSLILSSGDFGAAYLTEGWASRFLVEVFRRFAVVFVGYSIEDPVIRYMMDALAVDRAAGEKICEAYALVGSTNQNRQETLRQWRARGVEPLLFDQRNRFASLHKTLRAWGDSHRSGLDGRERVLIRNIFQEPKKPFVDDPVASQVVWALSDESGHLARQLARLDPVPSLGWLPVFDEAGLFDFPAGPPHGQAGGWRVPLADSGQRIESAPSLHPITQALAGC